MDLINNFISGFIVGILSGFVASMLFEYYKKKRCGKLPYLNTSLSGNLIRFDGQIQNTTSSQQTLSRLIKDVN
jgi:uncharacterized membrane protein YoaK (UPF0700 family)